jgi:drug/metabolite transporter (DMT)-like permease
VLGTSVAFVWYYQAVQRLGASRTVIFNNLVPVFGATCGGRRDARVAVTYISVRAWYTIRPISA